MTKGQSWEAQEERLDEGRCPIHGLFMSQDSTWFRLPNDERAFTFVGFPRQDCDVYARSSEYGGRADLLTPEVPVIGYYADDYPKAGEEKEPYEIWPNFPMG